MRDSADLCASLALCSLFGEDVQLLLDMDRANSPGCILVSEAALNLISNRLGQYTPVSKVMCGGQPMQMYAWTPEVSTKLYARLLPHTTKHLLDCQAGECVYFSCDC